MALCDEVHEHPDRGVMEMLERGFKFRRQPLLLMITNSGSDRNSICYEEHEHAVKVAAGTLRGRGRLEVPPGVRVRARPAPARALQSAWARTEWPPVELLTAGGGSSGGGGSGGGANGFLSICFHTGAPLTVSKPPKLDCTMTPTVLP